jgi:hypothetical protein
MSTHMIIHTSVRQSSRYEVDDILDELFWLFFRNVMAGIVLFSRDGRLVVTAILPYLDRLFAKGLLDLTSTTPNDSQRLHFDLLPGLTGQAVVLQVYTSCGSVILTCLHEACHQQQITPITGSGSAYSVDRIVGEQSGLVHPLSALVKLEIPGLGVAGDGFPISVTGILDDVFLNMKMMGIE